METVGIRKLRAKLAEYVNRATQGEGFIIIQRSEPVARLLPYEETQVDSITFLEGAEYEAAVKERARRHNAELLDPNEADRLVGLFAPLLVHQVMEQSSQNKHVARRMLLTALLKLEEGQP